jgi:Holliday junction resolvase RusA-like endonuclease
VKALLAICTNGVKRLGFHITKPLKVGLKILEYKLIIPGNPTPWTPPRLSKNRIYDIRFKEKEEARRILRTQWNENLIHGAVKLKFRFYMPIPKSSARSAKESMENGLIEHLKKPDLSNLVKFAEDVLKEIVILDDNIVNKIVAQKRYSSEPRTEITVVF